MRARASTIIQAQREVIFKHIADFSSHPAWRRSVIESSVSGEPAVGTRVTQRLTLAGHTLTAEFRITEFDPPHRISFVYEGPPRVRGGFTLEAADGSTRVHVFTSTVLGGAAELVEDRIRETVEAEARHELERLKSRVEGDAHQAGS